MNNVLAVFPKSPRVAEVVHGVLERAFPAVCTTARGWLCAERPISGEASTALVGSRLSWEGAAPVEVAPLDRDLDQVVRRLSSSEGEFGFAELERGGRFLVVRSAGGLVPVYVCRDEDAIWLGTSFEDLVRCRLRPPRFDAMVQALWAEGNAVFPDGRTFVQDVRILERGHYLLCDGERLTLGRYWEPRPDFLPEPSEAIMWEHAEALESVLVDSLGALDRDGANLLTLSGGVDSSSVAYVAAGLGFDFATLTFVAPTPTAEALQLSYVDRLIRELGISRVRKYQASDAFLNELFLRPLPALFFCPHPALRLFPEISSGLGVRVLFSGHFADEVCGYSQRLQDWIRHTPFRRLLDPRYPRPSGVRDLGRWLKRRALEHVGRPLLPTPRSVDSLFAPAIREEVADWGARERRELLLDPRPLRELSAWCRLDGWVAMHWECCSRAGVRPLHPFFSRRALELAFSCHPTELFGPGGKKILRRALRSRVPSHFLDRPDKGHWQVQRVLSPRRQEAGLPDEALELLRPECRGVGTLLTGLQHRKFSQIVIFARKVREVRHDGK